MEKTFRPQTVQLTDDTIYRNNKHLLQWKESGKPIQRNGQYSRFPDYKNIEYPWVDEDSTRSVAHWGQRKLLLSEVEFLSKFSSPGDRVIYIGGAPGVHIGLLAEFFNDIQFILFDPAEFSAELYNHPNVEIRQQLFTTTDSYRYKDVLLISDIRTADTDREERSIVEEKIVQDMRLQEHIYNVLKPKKALLKFRLPYYYVPTVAEKYKGKFEYLDGDIYLQAYSRKRSTETRLVPNGQTKIWDLKNYQDALYDFNYRRRVEYYKHPPIDGLDACYDCTTEYTILNEYSKLYEGVGSANELSQKINGFLSNGRYNPLTRPDTLGQKRIQHD